MNNFYGINLALLLKILQFNRPQYFNTPPPHIYRSTMLVHVKDRLNKLPYMRHDVRPRNCSTTSANNTFQNCCSNVQQMVVYPPPPFYKTIFYALRFFAEFRTKNSIKQKWKKRPCLRMSYFSFPPPPKSIKTNKLKKNLHNVNIGVRLNLP